MRSLYVITQTRVCRVAITSLGAAILLIGLTFALLPSHAAAGSGSWSRLNLAGQMVMSLAIDPTNATTIYAGTAGSGIFRSTDGGNTWVAINNGLGNLVVNAISIDPTNSAVILVGTGRGPLVGEPTAGVYRTTNSGASWSVALPNATSLTLARTPQNSGIVYSGGAGLFKSTNAGITWTRLARSAGSDLTNTDIFGLAVSPLNASVVLAVGNTEGGTGRVFRSGDAGATWSLVLDGLAPTFDVAFAPPSPSGGVVLVATNVGAYRSDDGGITFHLVSEELGSVAMRRVIFNPLSASTAYAATDRGVYQGASLANDWSKLDTTLGNPNVHTVTINQSSPQTLYAGTDDGVWTFTFTPPPPFAPVVSWYFAEGSTQPPFDTWFLVQNPTSTLATVRFTFELQGGGVVTRNFSVGPNSRFSLFANQVIPNTAFSTRVDSNQPVRAERSMFVGFDGDDVTGIPSPQRTWLFAEGSTQAPFHTWLLLQNPNSSTASAAITYLRSGGGPSKVQTLLLPPNSRTSVFVNQVLPNMAFSSRVDSDLPIVVERAMYRFPGNAATADAGVNLARPAWFFANAKTSTPATSPNPFDSWLLLQNPNSRPVSATITLFRTDGSSVVFTQSLAPFSRQSVFLNQILANASFGIRVDASDNIIAERSMFFGREPRGAMATPGSPDLATTWFLPEGSTQQPFTEQIYILNPNSATMTAHVDFELPGGQIVPRDFTVGPTRSILIAVNTIVPNSAVSATITTSLPSLVERQMFFSKLGSLGGTDAIGMR